MGYNSYSQEQKYLLKLVVLKTQYNDEKSINHDGEKKRILSLILIEDQFLIFTNKIQESSQVIYGNTYDYEQETDSLYAIYKFRWEFENTLTQKAGSAKVSLSLIPSYNGVVLFKCIILLEDQNYIVYEGYMNDEDFGLN